MGLQDDIVAALQCFRTAAHAGLDKKGEEPTETAGEKDE